MWDETYILSELPTEAETEEEIAFVLDALGLRRRSIVLDLCCGQGRHGRRLAEQGVTVIGVDSSRFLLAEAQKNDKWMHLIEADMRHIPVKPVCDAAINLFTSFGFFEDGDNRNVLAEVASALKPGGKFLLDYWNPYAVFQLNRTRNWWWISESMLALASVEYEADSGRLSDYRTIINVSTGEIRDSVNRIRFYFPMELQSMLAEVNLKVCAMYGDFDSSPFTLESRRLITIAEKQ
jgi:SAM-dependent methyltransferase